MDSIWPSGSSGGVSLASRWVSRPVKQGIRGVYVKRIQRHAEISTTGAQFCNNHQPRDCAIRGWLYLARADAADQFELPLKCLTHCLRCNEFDSELIEARWSASTICFVFLEKSVLWRVIVGCWLTSAAEQLQRLRKRWRFFFRCSKARSTAGCSWYTPVQKTIHYGSSELSALCT